MAVPEGTFQLFSRIEPPLQAGDYAFTTTHDLTAARGSTALGPGTLVVDPLDTHVRVRSPQYLLPPDQVLSTFPPAGSEGSYGARLPQVVIKRRTLPWERSVGAGHESEPWLALVLIAEGEAALQLNKPITECVTPGVRLDTPADAEKGNCLSVRKSVVDRIFPTQEEVTLLAHARLVDIHDTELMMGDDDGYLAVVICNRLPLPARDADGNEVPVKYVACLVNLCGQFEDLLEKAPEPVFSTLVPFALEAQPYLDLAAADHVMMGSASFADAALPFTTVIPKASAAKGTVLGVAKLDPGAAAPYENTAGWAAAAERGMSDIYAEMAQPFTSTYVAGYVSGVVLTIDRELRFPVLLHWSFTSSGEETFRSLMQNLSSGMLGTLAPETVAEASGRPPFEVVETGHVGLAHRTRRGDPVRSWYRGPLVPHPTVDGPSGRLPLAHAADQVRVVVPDGREDISLAAAFEIGRLLALSRPSMIAMLLRWRQLGFQVAQRQAAFEGAGIDWQVLFGLELTVDRDIGGLLGAAMAEALVARPEEFLGNPRPLVDPGREVLSDVSVNAVLARGLGLSEKVLSGGAGTVLGALQNAPVRLPREVTVPGDVRGIGAVLGPRLAQEFTRSAVQAVAPELAAEVASGGEVRGLNLLPLDLQVVLGGAGVPGMGIGGIGGFGGVIGAGGLGASDLGAGVPHGLARVDQMAGLDPRETDDDRTQGSRDGSSDEVDR